MTTQTLAAAPPASVSAGAFIGREDVEALHSPSPWDYPPCPGFRAHPFASAAWLIGLVVSTVGLVLVLSIGAAIPLLNIWVFGLLLEMQGRAGSEGVLAALRTNLRLGPRLVGLLAGVAVCLLPLWFLAGVAEDAELLIPGAPEPARLRSVLFVLQLLVTLNIAGALLRSGRFLGFFRIWRNISWLVRGCPVSEAKVDWSTLPLHISDRFRLGLLSIVGVLAWTLIPMLLFRAPRTDAGGPVLVTIFGALVAIPVLMWLPVLQARFASEGRLGAFRELKTARRLFRSAPVAWTAAIVLSLVLSVPFTVARLFPDVGKIVELNGFSTWLAMLIWVVSLLPARLMLGKACGRAVRSERERGRLVCWTCRLITTAFVLAYLLLLFLTPFVSSQGLSALFDQHLFLVPLWLRT